MQETSKQYDQVIGQCRSLFEKKMSDYLQENGVALLSINKNGEYVFLKDQKTKQVLDQAPIFLKAGDRIRKMIWGKHE